MKDEKKDLKKDLKKGEEEVVEKKSSWKGKLILAVVLTVVLAGATVVGLHFYSENVHYFTTDNARVTTDLFPIVTAVPGTLERFNVVQGQHVSENDVIGWVQNAPAMRSPVDGLVIHTSAVEDQLVGHEPVAVVADTAGIHIQANVEETDISRLQLGQRAIVTIDTFGNRQFTGYVAEIGHITQAELSGATLFFNTGGTFTRVTHLIPVKINIVDDVSLESFIGVNARVRIPLR